MDLPLRPCDCGQAKPVEGLPGVTVGHLPGCAMVVDIKHNQRLRLEEDIAAGWACRVKLHDDVPQPVIVEAES